MHFLPGSFPLRLLIDFKPPPIIIVEYQLAPSPFLVFAGHIFHVIHLDLVVLEFHILPHYFIRFVNSSQYIKRANLNLNIIYCSIQVYCNFYQNFSYPYPYNYYIFSLNYYVNLVLVY